MTSASVSPPGPPAAPPAIRPEQRKRTRRELLAAAVRFIEERGAVPSVAEVARAAGISRRTAYRYFPTVERLTIEATYASLRPKMDALLGAVQPSDDPAVRVERIVRSLVAVVSEHEALLRLMIRLTVATPGESIRGTGRIDWITAALEPARATLTPGRFEQLVSAVMLCASPESILTLCDTRDLTIAEAGEIAVVAARGIVRQLLGQAQEPRRRLNSA